MKLFSTLIFFLSFSVSAFSAEISGVIEQGTVPADTFKSGGALFVYARKEGVTSGPPVAVLRIADPKFPQKFTLTEKNVMMGGPEAFAGTLSVSAKYSAVSDAFDNSGPKGTDEKNKAVKVGAKDIKIVLKK